MKVNISFNDENYEELSRVHNMIDTLWMQVTKQIVEREEEMKKLKKGIGSLPNLSDQITQNPPFPNKIT